MSFVTLISLTLLAGLLRQEVHFLCALLSIEAVVLSLSVSYPIVTGLQSGSAEGAILVFLLTLGACEAALGLATLVLLVRSRGNDHLRCLSSQVS